MSFQRENVRRFLIVGFLAGCAVAGVACGGVTLGINREGRTDLNCFVNLATSTLTPLTGGAASIQQTPTYALITSPPEYPDGGDCAKTYYETAAANDPGSNTTRWKCSFACVPRDRTQTEYFENEGPCATIVNRTANCFHN
jgi:hypothetical protein